MLQHNFMNGKLLDVCKNTIVASVSECPEWLKQGRPPESSDT